MTSSRLALAFHKAASPEPEGNIVTVEFLVAGAAQEDLDSSNVGLGAATVLPPVLVPPAPAVPSAPPVPPLRSAGWNASGWAASPHYDDDGNWKPE